MRILAVEEKTVRIGSATRNSSIGFGAMTASALVVRTDAVHEGKPVNGLAFDSIGRYGHGGLLRERFIPRLIEAAPLAYCDEAGALDPAAAWDVMMTDEKAGGHGERSGAVGLLDAALWDIKAKLEGRPLWATLAAATGTRANGTLALYASGGHYRDSDDTRLLCDDVRRGMAQGHRRFKIKIGGASIADDVARIEAVLAVLDPGMTLAVDGNGTFSLARTLDYLDAFDGLPLAWIEEPVAPLDYALNGQIAALTKLPIATGENLFSRDDARNLMRHSGLRPERDILQFDISLSYGIVEYLRILDDMTELGWQRAQCAPHAGHLLAAHSVAGLGLGLAEVAMDSAGLFGSITAHLPVVNGVATLPDAPGAGLEASPAFGPIFAGLLN